MSYLVDALRKAERERHAQHVGDLYAASAGSANTAPGAGGGPWLWVVAILVAGNVALAVYVWRPQAGQPPATSTSTFSTAKTSAPASASGKSSANTMSREPTPPSSAIADDGQLDSRAGDRGTAGQTMTEATTEATAEGPRSTSRARMASDTPTPIRERAGAQGTARYSKESLADNGSPPARGAPPERLRNLPGQGSAADLPSVSINGQLYSTVAGRSFVLIGGRRYHEGERLASGPAVESIDPDGATLRYHGRRYHVPGPG